MSLLKCHGARVHRDEPRAVNRPAQKSKAHKCLPPRDQPPLGVTSTLLPRIACFLEINAGFSQQIPAEAKRSRHSESVCGSFLKARGTQYHLDTCKKVSVTLSPDISLGSLP